MKKVVKITKRHIGDAIDAMDLSFSLKEDREYSIEHWSDIHTSAILNYTDKQIKKFAKTVAMSFTVKIDNPHFYIGKEVWKTVKNKLVVRGFIIINEVVKKDSWNEYIVFYDLTWDKSNITTVAMGK